LKPDTISWLKANLSNLQRTQSRYFSEPDLRTQLVPLNLKPKNLLIFWAHHKSGSTMLSEDVLPAVQNAPERFDCMQSVFCLPPEKRVGHDACMGNRVNNPWGVMPGWQSQCDDGLVVFLRKPVRDLSRDDILNKYLVELHGGTCQVVLHQRHPFDTLTSMYLSFTANHVLAPGQSPEEEKHELQQMARLHALGVDEYVKRAWPGFLLKLDWILTTQRTLQEHTPCKVLMSYYEDLIEDPGKWARQLAEFLQLPAGTRTNLAGWAEKQAARTPGTQTSHMPYFYPGAHLRELKPDTISWLNANLSNLQRTQSSYFSRLP